MRWYQVIWTVSLAILLAACMPRQSIQYPVTDIVAVPDSPFDKAILAVKPFQDGRKPLMTNCPDMGVGQIQKDGKTFYYNCDNSYKTDSVTREISAMMVAHLKESHLFKDVLLADSAVPSDADYLLTGQVSKFDGLKEYSSGAVVAAQFGLLGALVNLAQNNPYEGTTVLDDVKLIRLKDNSVIWSGQITGHIEGTDTVDPSGWSCYTKANLSLREANGNLVNSLVRHEVSLNLPADPPAEKK
ncbi:hypothetical protein GMSM_38470 [Geomonas sp. Red276]